VYSINVKMNFDNIARAIIKLKIVFLITLFTISNSCVSINIKTDIIDHTYLQLKQKFAWMNPPIYNIISKEVNKQKSKIPLGINYIKLICSVIQAESGEYCNNNYEYMTRVVSHAGAVGVMQIMKVHTPKDPKSRYNPSVNVQKGVMYFTYCLQKSIKEGKSNPVQIACVYYNAGAGCKLWKYNNWGYVNKIQKYYTI
jgi:hypothetical protein